MTGCNVVDPQEMLLLKIEKTESAERLPRTHWMVCEGIACKLNADDAPGALDRVKQLRI